jgi:hypothetical protein
MQKAVDKAQIPLALPSPTKTLPPAPLPLRTSLHHREENDSYPDEVARVTDRLRVINCRDDIQWIVQLRSGEQWKSVSFCRTREALLRCVRERGGQPLPASLLGLPERHR